ncbi:MAG: hypothetical protein L7U87_04355 [Chlamydiales bacterium]|nr:hypothetical protein [Chlamydiales bacterium]
MKKNVLFLSLVEIIVAVILLTTISSTISISVYKYLQTGKAFKTEHNITQIKNALQMQFSRNESMNLSSGPEGYQVVNNWKALVDKTPLFNTKASQLKDGWGNELEVLFSEEQEDFKVLSKRYEQYKKKHGSLSHDENSL